MKIILNDTENYTLGMPIGDVNLESFKVLIKKLNVVVSFMEKRITSAKQISLRHANSNSGYALTRRERIEALKILYKSKTREEAIEALKIYDVKLQTVQQCKYAWIKKYNITAEELGISKLPEPRDYSKKADLKKAEEKQ